MKKRYAVAFFELEGDDGDEPIVRELVEIGLFDREGAGTDPAGFAWANIVEHRWLGNYAVPLTFNVFAEQWVFADVPGNGLAGLVFAGLVELKTVQEALR